LLLRKFQKYPTIDSYCINDYNENNDDNYDESSEIYLPVLRQPPATPPLLGQLTVVLGIIHVKYIITLKINRHEMIRSKRLSDYDTSVVVIVIEAKGPRCVFLFGGKASECKR
jgi:hypothetical protein